MGYEFELKYSAEPWILRAVQAQTAASWQTIAMETTYFDTPGRQLSALRYTLRRRLENGVSVCTLKTPMPDGGRGEWEVICQTISQAIPELCKLGAPEALVNLTAQGVQPCCGARFTRRAATVEAGGTVLEIALDEGVLFGGGRELPLCELEVELKSGEKTQAVRYAQALAGEYGLEPQPNSKVRRAMALLEGE